MPELFYAFLVPLAFASKYVTEKVILRRISVYTSLFLEYSVAVILFLLSVLAFSNLVLPPASMLPLLTLTSVVGAGAIIVYYKAINLSKQVSLIYAIAATYIFFSVFLSSLFLGEPFLAKYYLAIPLVIVSLGLLSLKPGKKLVLTDPAVLLAFATGLGWGVYYTLAKVVSTQINPFNATLFMEAGVWAGLAGYILFSRKEIKLAAPRETVPLLLFAAVLFVVGAFSFNISFVLVGVSLTTLIDAVSPGLTALIAFVFLGEQLSKRQYWGLFLMIASLAILTL